MLHAHRNSWKGGVGHHPRRFPGSSLSPAGRVSAGTSRHITPTAQLYDCPKKQNSQPSGNVSDTSLHIFEVRGGPYGDLTIWGPSEIICLKQGKRADSRNRLKTFRIPHHTVPSFSGLQMHYYFPGQALLPASL